MARIPYPATTIGGNMVSEAVDHFRKGRDLIARAKSLADSVTAGGVSPVNLEGGVEFNIPVGSGAAYYTAIGNMKTNAATITDAAIADLDNGG